MGRRICQRSHCRTSLYEPAEQSVVAFITREWESAGAAASALSAAAVLDRFVRFFHSLCRRSGSARNRTLAFGGCDSIESQRAGGIGLSGAGSGGLLVS